MPNPYIERIIRPTGPIVVTSAQSIRVTSGQFSGEALTYADPIYKNATGNWFRSRADTPSTMPTQGVTLSTVPGAGIAIVVLVYGILPGVVFVAVDRGKTLYVGATGGLDVAPPPVGAGFEQQEIGYVLDTGQGMIQLVQISVEIP